jgi:hypothetical protein
MSQHSHHHDLSRSTHTPELVQLRELNEQLAAAAATGTSISADELGLAGRPVEGSAASSAPSGLPATAVLDHLSAQGPPDFPYIAGQFHAAAGQGSPAPLLQVGMHTAALRKLSATFHLRHLWGA